MEKILKRNTIEDLDSRLLKALQARDPEALEIIGEMKRIGEETGDNGLIGYAYYRYAYYYYFTSMDLSRFRENVQIAIRFLLRSDNKEYLGGAYNLIAYDAQDRGCYDVAYAYFMTAVRTTRQLPGIALPGIIEANAGRLLIELGEYRKGRKQQRDAVRIIKPIRDMHVYNYNMIVTYADIALASFLMGDTRSVGVACRQINGLLKIANAEERDLSMIYALLSNIYLALLSKNDDLLEEALPKLLEKFTSISSGELIGFLFEIESLCNNMLDSDYITQAEQILAAAGTIAEDDDLTAVLRYYTIKVTYYEKIHDLDDLRQCLRDQHEVQKKQVEEARRMIHYAMDFSDMIESIAEERKKAEEENAELRRRANTDPLTGLPNRKAMTGYLREKYDTAIEEGALFGIGIIDVDDFKQYNDTYGHKAGDECLALIGQTLLAYNSDPDIYCVRYGGDEFVVGYFSKSEQDIQRIAADMEKKVLSRSRKINGGAIHISQGIHCAVPDEKSRFWDYLTIADKELYKIKKEKAALCLKDFGRS